MKEFQVGLIGYGWAAGAHHDAINATGKARVTAVFSERDLDAAQIGENHGGGEITCYQDLSAMLADPDLDAVSICSYPNLHAHQAVAAAEAGKHLIIEKPLALTMKDCHRILQAVEKAGVKACVCFEVRFSSQFRAIKSFIDSGLLGKIHYGEVDYYHGIGPWYGQFRWNTTVENGGSSLLSAGCHALDALLLCMGDTPVKSVVSSATGSENATFAQYEYPTTTVTIVNFEDGRIGKVASVIDCLQPYYFHTHLVGSEGSLLDDKFHSEKIDGLNKDRWSNLSVKAVDSGDVSDHPYEEEFTAFFDALANDSDMPLASLQEAYRSFEVIFAADLSVKEGRPVSLSEIRL